MRKRERSEGRRCGSVGLMNQPSIVETERRTRRALAWAWGADLRNLGGTLWRLLAGYMALLSATVISAGSKLSATRGFLPHRDARHGPALGNGEGTPSIGALVVGNRADARVLHGESRVFPEGFPGAPPIPVASSALIARQPLAEWPQKQDLGKSRAWVDDEFRARAKSRCALWIMGPGRPNSAIFHLWRALVDV